MGNARDELGRPVVDFDHHSADFREHGITHATSLRAGCPVAYTESHGGFWVVSRREDIVTATRDVETFRSGHELVERDGIRLAGIGIPETPLITGLAEHDPPEWHLYRKALTPLLTPNAVDRMRPKIHEITTNVIDDVIESGRVDFVLDVINPVPARVTMLVVGLPMDMAEGLEAAVHTIDGAGPEETSPEQAAAFEKILEVIATAIGAARQRPPEDTVMSRLVYLADDNGLADEDITSVALSVILGGIGTTTALLGHALHHLDDNRAHRQALIQDPGLLSMAVEELLRTFPPVVGMARTVAKDTVLGGERLRRGERVLLLYASANRDEQAFDAPNEINLDRRGNRHTTFGLGIHRCLGSNLARAEIVIVLGEILRRIPDYALERGGVEPYETVGRMDGYRRLLATFTPGRRAGQRD